MGHFNDQHKSEEKSVAKDHRPARSYDPCCLDISIYLCCGLLILEGGHIFPEQPPTAQQHAPPWE
jgi:hypothetical protein